MKFYEKIDDYDNLYKAIIETLDQRNFPIANEFYYEDFHLLNNYNLQVGDIISNLIYLFNSISYTQI